MARSKPHSRTNRSGHTGTPPSQPLGRTGRTNVGDGKRRRDCSVVEVIITEVKRGVRDGRFVPGQRLVECNIQSRLGVSRGPIREAVRRLAAEGIVELRHKAGASIRSLSRTDVCNEFRIGEVLEGLAARLSGENVQQGHSTSELEELEVRFDQEFDGSPAAYMRYDDRFHGIIIALSRNEQLIELVRQLNVRTYRLQYQSLRESSSFRRSRLAHKAIPKSLRNGEGQQAEQLMRQHIRRRLKAILVVLDIE
jgi:DNA-binding GntR family transcriptional regulator